MRSVPAFIIAFLFCSNSLLAQNRYTDSSATCIAFWNNKDNRVYQVKHSKEKLEAGTRKSFAEGIYEAHIRVLDSAATGFTLEWAYKNFKAAIPNDHALNSLNSIMEGLTIVYKTDDVGMFTELVNWEAVRDFAFAAYEKAVGNNNDKEFVVALNQVKAIFQSKENIEALLIKEIQLFHAPFGMEYSTSGMIAETELPNVMGGSPFPATVIIKLDEVNVASDRCRVSMEQAIDKGKAGPIIADMLKKLSANSKETEAEINTQINAMEITDLNQYTYHLTSGWHSRVFFQRTSNIGDRKQVEVFEITVKK